MPRCFPSSNGSAKGEGELEDLNRLENLAELLTEGSLCALGKTAANPILSTLRYFREEYEEHIKNHKCRAKLCRALIRFSVIEKNCTGCLLCKKRCPEGCISGEREQLHVIDTSRCIKCGICMDVCKDDAVRVI